MRLCGIIPDLTHYYGELGRDNKSLGEGGMEVRSVVLSSIPPIWSSALSRPNPLARQILRETVSRE